MHETWGIPFDWPWPLFVLALIGALILLWYGRRRNPWARPAGIVAIWWVLYEGLVWDVWGPLGWLWQIAFWLSLIPVIVYAFTGALSLIARILAYAVAALAILIILISIVSSWNNDEVNFGQPDNNGAAASQTPNKDVESPSPSPSPSQASESPGTVAPSTDCRTVGAVPDGITIPSSPRPTWRGTYTKPNGESVTGTICAWPMSTEEPDSLGFTIPTLDEPDTSMQLARTLKRSWYNPATFWAPTLSELDDIVFGIKDPVSELSVGGWSTQLAQSVGVDVSDVLSDSTYYSDGSSITVILPNGETFSVVADTGELRH